MWYALIVGVVGVGALLVAVWLTRGFGKRLRGESDAAITFTLQDLRELLADGRITRAEYEVMRGAVIERMGARKSPNHEKTSGAEGLADRAHRPEEREEFGEEPK